MNEEGLDTAIDGMAQKIEGATALDHINNGVIRLRALGWDEEKIVDEVGRIMAETLPEPNIVAYAGGQRIGGHITNALDTDDTDYSSPDADMSDRDIKQAVYDRIDSGDDDHPEAWEE